MEHMGDTNHYKPQAQGFFSQRFKTTLTCGCPSQSWALDAQVNITGTFRDSTGKSSWSVGNAHLVYGYLLTMPEPPVPDNIGCIQQPGKPNHKFPIWNNLYILIPSNWFFHDVTIKKPLTNRDQHTVLTNGIESHPEIRGVHRTCLQRELLHRT